MVCHGHPANYPGGAEIASYALFNELNSRQDTDAYFFAAMGTSLPKLGHAGTSFAGISGADREVMFVSGGMNYFLISLEDPYVYREFAEFLFQTKPDVIHFHHVLNLGVEALNVARLVLPSAALIYTLHEFIPICFNQGQMLTKSGSLCYGANARSCVKCFPERSEQEFVLREQFIKAALCNIDRFISPSEFVLNRFREWGLPPDKLALIDNGHALAGDTGQKLPVRRDNTPVRFGFFGQINVYKGTRLLVEAALILLREDVTDFSIGIHGTLARQSEEFVEDFNALVDLVRSCDNYSGQLQLHGSYEAKYSVRLMRECDYVVVPSHWWENSPLVIQEARIAGRPVICSNIGGMAEKVRNDVDGLHFNVSDAYSLASTLKRCIEDSNTWDHLAANIGGVPTVAESAEQHVSLYMDVLKSKPKTSDVPVARQFSNSRSIARYASTPFGMDETRRRLVAIVKEHARRQALERVIGPGSQ